MQPKDLLEYAEACESSDSEACIRAAISRAYYACYHALAPHLAEFPAEVADSDTHLRHRETWRRLKAWRAPESYLSVKNMDRAAKRVAMAYDSALKARALADYELQVPHDFSDVTLQCRRVREILTFASQLEIQLQRKAS